MDKMIFALCDSSSDSSILERIYNFLKNPTNLVINYDEGYCKIFKKKYLFVDVRSDKVTTQVYLYIIVGVKSVYT